MIRNLITYGIFFFKTTFNLSNFLFLFKGLHGLALDCYDTKTITFYECFGCVTIVKTIYYYILECTRIVHVFCNVEFRN